MAVGPITLNIWFLRVNSVSNSSAVNIGSNLLVGWQSTNKEMNGVGSLNGDGARMGALLAGIDDRDLIDMAVASTAAGAPAVVGPSQVSAPSSVPQIPLWPPATKTPPETDTTAPAT